MSHNWYQLVYLGRALKSMQGCWVVLPLGKINYYIVSYMFSDLAFHNASSKYMFATNRLAKKSVIIQFE
jgi:hypothetical protein